LLNGDEMEEDILEREENQLVKAVEPPAKKEKSEWVDATNIDLTEDYKDMFCLKDEQIDGYAMTGEGAKKFRKTILGKVTYVRIPSWVNWQPKKAYGNMHVFCTETKKTLALGGIVHCGEHCKTEAELKQKSTKKKVFCDRKAKISLNKVDGRVVATVSHNGKKHAPLVRAMQHGVAAGDVKRCEGMCRDPDFARKYEEFSNSKELEQLQKNSSTPILLPYDVMLKKAQYHQSKAKSKGAEKKAADGCLGEWLKWIESRCIPNGDIKRWYETDGDEFTLAVLFFDPATGDAVVTSKYMMRQAGFMGNKFRAAKVGAQVSIDATYPMNRGVLGEV